MKISLKCLVLLLLFISISESKPMFRLAGEIKNVDNYPIKHCIHSHHGESGKEMKMSCFPTYDSRYGFHYDYKELNNGKAPTRIPSTWKMIGSEMLPNTEIDGQWLKIADPVAKNSGSFVCTAKAGGVTMSFRRHLFVGTVPTVKYEIRMEEQFETAGDEEDCDSLMQTYNEQNPEPIDQLLCNNVENCKIHTACKGSSVSHTLKIPIDFTAYCDTKCFEVIKKEQAASYRTFRMNLRKVGRERFRRFNVLGTTFKYTCEEGHFLMNKTICAPCGPGTYMPHSNHYHSDTESAPLCELCPRGTFQNMYGSSSCIDCPGNSHVKYEGANSIGDCHSGFPVNPNYLPDACLYRRPGVKYVTTPEEVMQLKHDFHMEEVAELRTALHEKSKNEDLSERERSDLEERIKAAKTEMRHLRAKMNPMPNWKVMELQMQVEESLKKWESYKELLNNKEFMEREGNTKEYLEGVRMRPLMEQVRVKSDEVISKLSWLLEALNNDTISEEDFKKEFSYVAGNYMDPDRSLISRKFTKQYEYLDTQVKKAKKAEEEEQRIKEQEAKDEEAQRLKEEHEKAERLEQKQKEAELEEKAIKEAQRVQEEKEKQEQTALEKMHNEQEALEQKETNKEEPETSDKTEEKEEENVNETLQGPGDTLEADTVENENEVGAEDVNEESSQEGAFDMGDMSSWWSSWRKKRMTTEERGKEKEVSPKDGSTRKEGKNDGLLNKVDGKTKVTKSSRKSASKLHDNPPTLLDVNEFKKNETSPAPAKSNSQATVIIGGAVGAAVIVMILLIVVAMTKRKKPEKSVEFGEDEELIKSSVSLAKEKIYRAYDIS